jgi:hypothetical protein
MKILSLLFMVAAVLSLAVGGISRLVETPPKGIMPQTFYELTIACLLFSIALSLHRKD